MTKIITIDGPSGTGKGTIANQLATNLKWHCLDSGALYRILGYLVEINQVAFNDTQAIVALAQKMQIEFKEGQILLAGQSVENEIRTETAGMRASKVATLAPVRQALLQWQRDFAKPPGLVADGRDMGSVVFPNAQIKIYLTADAKERANRRYLQLKEQGINANIARLIEEIEARDKQDRERENAPLIVPTGALEVDTTQLNIEQVLQLIQKKITEYWG